MNQEDFSFMDIIMGLVIGIGFVACLVASLLVYMGK
jgi:hypothetical protein